MSRISRRKFMERIGMGGAVATLPLLPRSVWAQSQPPPKRFVAFFTGNGTRSIPQHEGSGTGTSFDLGYMLSPLQPFKSKVAVIRGVDMSVRSQGPGGGHQQGTGGFLTGYQLGDGTFCGGNNCSTQSGWAQGISIDQEIVQQLGTSTPIASLELGVRVAGSNNRHRISYRGADDRLTPVDDPSQVYDRLMSKVGEGTGDLERRKREKRSVLDFVSAEIQSAQGRMGNAERQQLDAHLTSLRDVESRIDTLPTETCDLGTAVAPMPHRDNNNYPLVGQLQMDLIGKAFACDLTRVATLLWTGGTSGQVLPWLGISDSHHTLSHKGDTDTAAQQQLADVNKWYAEQFAYLLGVLDSIPEGGGTVLDNTAVLWGTGIAKGNNHASKDYRLVLAGNIGGFFKTGQRMVLSGRQHNDVLVTILNGMGIPATTFGNPAYSTGPISGLQA